MTGNEYQKLAMATVTLCGSIRYEEEFLRVQKELTLRGKIVLSVGFFPHPGDHESLDTETRTMLGDIHKRKIDMADAIFVINKNGHIGQSTQSEIEYAKANGKKIEYLEAQLLEEK